MTERRRVDAATVEALRRSVAPDQLRGLARAFPGSGDVFGALAAALEAEDPVPAVDDALRRVFGDAALDPGTLTGWLARLARTFGPTLDAVREVARGAAGDAETLGAEQRAFSEAAREEDDPALRVAFEALADPEATREIASLFGDLDHAAAAVGDVIAAAGAGRAPAAGLLAGLERDLRDLEGRARRADPTRRLLDAFDALRTSLERRDDRRSAEVALMAAVLRHDASLDASGAFEHALSLAERFSVLSVAQEAASTLQGDAVRRGDFATVAALARRLVAVADVDGEFRPRVLGRLEEALAVARSGAPTRGYDLADQAHELAKDVGIPELIARAALAKVHIVEQVDPERAAEAYGAIADALAPRDDDGERAVAGRALLGLARCRPHGPQRLAAWQRAQRLGAELGDRLLYVHGSLGIVEENLEAGDRLATVAGIVQFRAAAMHMGTPDDAKPFDRVAAGLRAQWGAEAFDKELLAFRARMPYAS